MSFLGITERVTDNEALQFIGDAAIVVVGALVVNNLVIQPAIAGWWPKKKEEPKPEPTGPKGGKKIDEPSFEELIKKYTEQDGEVDFMSLVEPEAMATIKAALTPENLEEILAEAAPHRGKAKQLLKALFSPEELEVVLHGLSVIEDLLEESRLELIHAEREAAGERLVQALAPVAEEEEEISIPAEGEDDLKTEWERREKERAKTQKKNKNKKQAQQNGKA